MWLVRRQLQQLRERLLSPGAAVLRSKPSLWLMAWLLMPGPGRRRFFALYSYFRWADDVVDAPGRSQQEVIRFVERQVSLSEALLEGQRPELRCAPERALREAAGDGRDPLLQRAIREMWAALSFDARRPQSPLSSDDLERQIARVGDAYTAALLACFGHRGPVPEELWLLSRAATAVHHLRDLALDQALGYLNLPRSHARAHGIDPDSFTEVDLAPYVCARAEEIRAMFRQGRAALHALPSLRARALFALLARSYAARLERMVSACETCLSVAGSVVVPPAAWR